MLGAAIVVESTDSAQWLDKMESSLEIVKKLASDFDPDEAEKVLSLGSYTKAAEELAGVKVHQFKIDLSASDHIDEEDIESAHEIIGSDGLLLRNRSRRRQESRLGVRRRSHAGNLAHRGREEGRRATRRGERSQDGERVAAEGKELGALPETRPCHDGHQSSSGHCGGRPLARHAAGASKPRRGLVGRG